MNKRLSFSEAAEVVKSSLDIVETIGRHVALKRQGRSYLGLCPFHKEKTPSFNVVPAKQIFKCFGCGEGGDTLSFLMKQDNKNYGEVIRELAEEMGIEIIEEGRSQQPAKGTSDILLRLQTKARDFFMEQLKIAPPVLDYLSQRQIDPKWQLEFGLGYAPAGWENLVQHLLRTDEDVKANPTWLEKSGLANLRQEGNSYYDRFRNRLIIPILDDRGRVVAFGGRTLDPEDKPKYLNSPETTIYNKSRILYGFSRAKEAIRETSRVVIMEGYFDVISAHMAGITEAVGVCGTSLTEDHLKLLHRAGAENFYLCFDADQAGQSAALRAIEMVENQLLELGVSIRVVSIPEGKDPDDYLKTHSREAFLDCLTQSQDYLQFKFDQALVNVDRHTAEGRIRAVQILTPMLAAIRQPVVRHECIRALSERLDVNEETFLLEIKRISRRNATYYNKKNYADDAISDMQGRYKGRSQWAEQNRQRQNPIPENLGDYRKPLLEKTPLEDKEHLLLSLLLLDVESYRLIMEMLTSITLQSAPAQSLVALLQDLEGQWEEIDGLIERLRERCHQQDDPRLMPYLADRIMMGEVLLQNYGLLEKGLKSFDYREKLKRITFDIVKTIQSRQNTQSLSRLAEDGRHQEQSQDDQAALEVQKQLREALQARRMSHSPQSDTGVDHQCERQGV